MRLAPPTDMRSLSFSSPCSLWPVVAGAAIALGSLSASSRTQAAASTVDAASISRAAVAAVRAQAGEHPTGLTLTPQPLDRRLRLPACDRPLEAFLTDGQVRQQTAVGVRCAGSVRWTIYTSVAVESVAPVLVSRYSLPEGAELTLADFERVTRRLPGLLSGFVTDPAALTGQRLRRPLGAGQPVTIEALAPAPLIRRGQHVVVVAHAAGIEVRVTGVALSDGRLSDRIRVQNLSSNRIIEGIVRSDTVVETPL